ncbi:VWA domain-containing protein [Streptomyces sp. NPDC050982]|uniref:VWA domain-containing protein n=1 Tax=Streptomyces sp. NPDC050982 TaxID=3154746 RepID=UPI0033C4EC0C
MAAEEALVPKRAGKPRKGRFAASLAVRTSKAKRHSPRVVLAFPGGSSRPFESGEISCMARRVAILGEFLAPGTGVEPWIYTAQAHRLPQLLPANAAEWIEDWAVVPPKSLLTRDAPPNNRLLESVDRYGLFDSDDAAEAIRTITAGLPEGGAPTLVLFHIWAPMFNDPSIADQLEAASGANAFWQFFGDPDLTHVVWHLDELRAEAPHITNVGFYRGWNLPQGTPEYLLFRGALKPFARWLRQPGGARGE